MFPNGFVDIRTASFFNGMVGLVFCLYMGFVWRTRKTYPGFGEWTIAALGIFTAMELIFLRDLIPAWLSVTCSNVFAVGSTVLLAQGLARFFGRAISQAWLFLASTVALIISAYYTYVNPDVRARIILTSMVSCGTLLFALTIVRSAAAKATGTKSGWLAASFATNAAITALRIGLTIKYEGDIQSFLSASAIQGVFLVTNAACQIAIFLGLLLLHTQRTEAELQRALAEVRTLQGVIPICASCKKIRDDHGAWNQLEVYISKHSEAEFTHGYCPDCSTRILETLPPF